MFKKNMVNLEFDMLCFFTIGILGVCEKYILHVIPGTKPN